MSDSAHSEKKLSAFPATAIAGNDILSSCLYVTGIAVIFAGVYAPFVFILIAAVLWLYKHVYTEVVEALPLNGGAYNCLLNATGKNIAAVAGVMTALSYVATSVISAKTAAEYVHTIIHIPVMPLTAGIIIAFAILTILGVKDSAKVAMGIFAFHIFSLVLFISMGLLQIFNGGSGFLLENWHATQALVEQQGILRVIFIAFSASLLGVSGFESSANFVEEQDVGVFRKTLRNMLAGVTIFNPLIAIILLTTLPLTQVAVAKDFVLAESALLVGGEAFRVMIVVNAFLVLSGAVLASFVGATGLLYRMTLDHCLPSSILLPRLKQRNTNITRIVVAFALLCLSILFMTKGDLLSLAGVYTISFLGVMTAFAIGNMVLRMSRPDLKRTYQGPFVYVVLAALSTAAGIMGNVLIDPHNLLYFSFYFVPSFFVVMMMIYRDYILDAALKVTRHIPFLYNHLYNWFEHVTKPRIVLFCHDPRKLYEMLLYIKTNETSLNISVVYCSNGSAAARSTILELQEYLRFFKTARIFPQHSLTLLIEDDLDFGPACVRSYAKRFRIQRNNIFIGSLHHTHEFNFEDLGGVRIIQ